MSANVDTVADRFAVARAQLDPTTVLAAIVLVAAFGFTMAFMQEPLAHDAFHDFRHGAGITCH